MTTKFYDNGLDWDLPLSVMDAHAAEVNSYMKATAEGWNEIGIGLYVDESRLFLFDCNAIVADVYQRHDTSYQWYCGADASSVASIRTVDGLKEFLEDFKKGEFDGMQWFMTSTYLQKMRQDYPDFEAQRRLSYQELKELEAGWMTELGWTYNEIKKRWYKA